MEIIKYVAQFENMVDNKIIGMPNLIDSEIKFDGKNNILFCANSIQLENVVFHFKGDNSIVYLCSSLKHKFELTICSDSVMFIGRNNEFGDSISVNIFENQNVVIGDDCIIGNNVNITTSDCCPIYDNGSKNRLNFSNSVLVGDHVMIGNNVFISKGVKIGSGTIIDNASFVPSNVKIHSNLLISGNPARIIHKNVFFVNSYIDSFGLEDSLSSKKYKSDVFIFNEVDKETLSFNKINEIIYELDVESTLEFLQKLFVLNRRKNRFSIDLKDIPNK